MLKMRGAERLQSISDKSQKQSLNKRFIRLHQSIHQLWAMETVPLAGRKGEKKEKEP